jgi:hypothetical protein
MITNAHIYGRNGTRPFIYSGIWGDVWVEVVTGKSSVAQVVSKGSRVAMVIDGKSIVCSVVTTGSNLTQSTTAQSDVCAYVYNISSASTIITGDSKVDG